MAISLAALSALGWEHSTPQMRSAIEATARSHHRRFIGARFGGIRALYPCDGRTYECAADDEGGLCSTCFLWRGVRTEVFTDCPYGRSCETRQIRP